MTFARVRRVCVFGTPWPGGLGDAILFNIFLALLKRAFPRAEIVYVVGIDAARRLCADGHSYADRVVICPGDYDEDPRWWERLFADIRETGYDCCLFDPAGQDGMAERAAQAGIGIRIGVVTGNAGDRHLTVPVRVPPPGEHGGSDLLDYAQALAGVLGLPAPGPDDAVPPFRYRPEPVPALPRPVVAVHPGGEPGWNRRWPLARYGELCRRLAASDRASFVLVGSPDELPELTTLRDRIETPGTRVEISAGETLHRLASRLKDADLLVANDSAPAHIAAAVGTSTVVLYGPSISEFWWRRVYPRHHGVNHHHVCRFDGQASGSVIVPCRYSCHYPYVAADGPYPRCLTDIQVDEVFRAARVRLATTGDNSQLFHFSELLPEAIVRSMTMGRPDGRDSSALTPAEHGLSGADAVLTTVIDIIVNVSGIDEGEITASRRIEDLGIDSLLAGEIIAQTGLALGIDIDFRKIGDDWSDMTLGELARQIWSGSDGG